MSHLFSPYGNFTRATKDGQRFTIISGCCNGLLRLLVVVRWLDGGGLILPMSVLGWFRTQLQQRYIVASYMYIYMMYWFNTISSSTFLFSILFSCYMFLLCEQLVIHIYQYICHYFHDIIFTSIGSIHLIFPQGHRDTLILYLIYYPYPPVIKDIAMEQPPSNVR